MKPLKEKVSITLDSDIVSVVKSLAEDSDRSMSQYINLAIKEHIKRLPHELKEAYHVPKKY